MKICREFEAEDFTKNKRDAIYKQIYSEIEEIEILGLDKDENLAEKKMKLDYLLNYEYCRRRYLNNFN